MFNAVLLTLSGGQSYGDIKVLEDDDLDEFNIPKIFEQWTISFLSGNECIIAHHWEVRLIKLSNERAITNDSIDFKRIILKGDTVYDNISLVRSGSWKQLGIPNFFARINGIAGQMVFTCDEGTFITHDANIVSVIMDNNHFTGIANRSFSKYSSVKHMSKQSNKPNTVNGKIFKD